VLIVIPARERVFVPGSQIAQHFYLNDDGRSEEQIWIEA